ncbi:MULTISPECIES: AbiTii domain-containing protein [Gammaproteobacteria]|jgi:hypothetical protein|uniref:AbiTii domain-containing protein n=1 Tax=Aeromonas caviae TaxID=648 RepID=A0A443XEW4_AERCA|nr:MULTISPECIES: hypothetical protein [Gammaproteobacteria]UTA15085.1 hypothetical protein J3S84_00505 [Enterobacter cloacae]AUZ78202.1 hypothetical protein C2U40_25860 [Aeromonas sp. ASNIH4]MDH1505960.1 hypothetical protein [Aeromonas caviae]MDH1807132.1 hypothetical protein [Aeromonas caviae]POU32636.1 hypothetical protein C3405_21095 [Aeromonas hydrophila]
MPAHVPELITLASDPNVEITKLLRMAKVVARLLQQPEAIIWLDHELQGYPDGCGVPRYRQRRGNLAYWQAGSHHVLSVANTERAVQWQTCPLSLPASELAELAATGKALRVRFPPELMSLLMAEIGTEREVEICMPTVQVRALIAAVQERVLDWALALAASGVQGDSMSVTPQERQVAPVSIHIGGNATGVQIQLNSPGGHQQQTVSGEQKTDALSSCWPGSSR